MVLDAFLTGCPNAVKSRHVEDYRPSDVAVVFGVAKWAYKYSKHRAKIINEQQEKGFKTVVLETGYVKRGAGEYNYYAAGFNGLNRAADFKNQGMPSDRWEKLDMSLLPWLWESYRTGTDIILCGQVPHDANVQNIRFQDFLEVSLREIRKYSDRKIIFRPHPMMRLPPIEDTEYSTGPLAFDLNRAHALVVYNSNISVDAVIAGVPVFAGNDNTMAWDMCNKDIRFLENPEYPDRHQWAWDLAYSQWTPDEMREGLTWRHLFD